jgi:hypothetical protein
LWVVRLPCNMLACDGLTSILCTTGGAGPEPWLSELSELSDTVGALSDTVGALSDCVGLSDCWTPVGPLSDHCRTTVGGCRTSMTGKVHTHCRTLSDCRTTVGLSDCRTVGALSDHCRTTVGLSDCRTVGLLSDLVGGLSEGYRR